MIDLSADRFARMKGVSLGALCKYGHDHGGGSYRHIRNSTCAQCQLERIVRWHASPKGLDAHRRSKLKHSDSIAAASRLYRQNNKEKILKYNRDYREKNNEWFISYYRIYNNKRRSTLLKATPSWANESAIISIYEKAIAQGREVDHIVPLHSNLVCGLHVENNLQILTRMENIKKGNRWWPDMPGS